MAEVNEFTKELRVILDAAIELEADPKILEENRIKVSPRCGYDLEVLQAEATRQGVMLVVNNIYLTELDESKKELDNFCSILNIAGVSHDMVGINKKLLKYRLVVFPASEIVGLALENDAKKFEKLEIVFEKGAIQARDSRGELEDNSERGERIRQKEEASQALSRYGIEFQAVDAETIEVFPSSHTERQEIERTLKEYRLVQFVYKTDKYTKIPMSAAEKREIVKDLAAKFKQYGNGFLEMKNAYTIVAYAKSEKLRELYKKMFSEYWYRYVEVDGEIKALRLVVENLYSNGEMFTNDEWSTIKHKANEMVESLSDVVIDFSNEQVIIRAPKFDSVRTLYWLKNYDSRKLEAENDKGFIYTNITFKFDE
ncbi:hypothetical protein [Enterococcus larvae]|nr:hypothetical protein [Enterococcus larvae]